MCSDSSHFLRIQSSFRLALVCSYTIFWLGPIGKLIKGKFFPLVHLLAPKKISWMKVGFVY